jgi:hypothetical protein
MSKVTRTPIIIEGVAQNMAASRNAIRARMGDNELPWQIPANALKEISRNIATRPNAKTSVFPEFA